MLKFSSLGFAMN